MIKKIQIIKKNFSNDYLIYLLYFFIVFEFVFKNKYGGGADFQLLFNYNNFNFKKFLYSTLNSTTATRIIGEFIYIAISYLTKWNYIIINLLPVLTWFSIIIILKKTFRVFLSKQQILFFQLSALFPFICTSVYASPIYAGQYFFAILFWALSLYYIVKFSSKKKSKFFLLHLFFLTIAIWTIESFPNLLIFTIALPIINSLRKETFKNYFYYFKIYIFPVLLIFLIFLLHKLIINTSFNNQNIYQLNIGYYSIYQGLYYFFAISIELIILLLTSLNFIDFVFAIPIAIVIFLILKHNCLSKNNYNIPIILYLSFFSLIALSMVFFLSGFPASTFGYFNKLLVPAYINISLIIGILFSKYFEKIRYFCFLFFFLVVLSFQIQISNFIKASVVRNEILNSIYSIIKKNDLKNINLITILPIFLNSNYNNERIFFYNSTVEYFLKTKNIELNSYWMINERMKNDYEYMKNINIFNFFNEIKNQKYYLFEYNQSKKKVNFIEFKNNKEIKKFLSNYKFENEEKRFIINQKIRYFIKKIYKSYF